MTEYGLVLSLEVAFIALVAVILSNLLGVVF